MPYTTFDSQKIYFVLVDLSVFSYLTPLNVKSKHLGCEFKYFLCYLLVWRFPKTRITRDQKKNVFWLIKNKDKIVGDQLYFYYINKEQKLVVMYLELIFTGIKTERWKVAEIYRSPFLGLKQVGKIVCVGTKTSKKEDLCLIWSRENARAEI